MTQVIGQTVLIGHLPEYGEEQIDAEGFPYRPVIGQLPGWHVNIPNRDMTTALEPYRVTPANPRNTYALSPHEAAYLRFADEGEAFDVLKDAGLLPDADYT